MIAVESPAALSLKLSLTHLVGNAPGPITKKLIDAYSKDVGCDFVGQYLKFLN